MSIPDTRSMGRSKGVPFIEGEEGKDRHQRRFDAALANKEPLVAALAERNILVWIKNAGEHWVFRKGSAVAEWWPRSAKLVLNRNYNQGIHCHDTEQALAILKERL